MANMTFKANLLPYTNLGYNLGSSNLKWNIYGNITPAGTTAQFYRGDNTWSNNLEGTLTISNNGIIKIDHTSQGARTAGSVYNAFQISFKNSTNTTVYNAYPIRYVGTNGTDGYNSCVVLGSQNGTTWVSSGESSSSMPGLIEYNSENLYLSSDGGIFAYTACANDGSSYIQTMAIQSNGNVWVPNGNVWTGTNNDTTKERQLGVQSGAGQLYLYSVASTTGNRGLYVTAHGTGAAKSVIIIDTNNNATFNGNATTASKWATARTLTVGSTGKSVDGSANVSWSHAEIGATVSNAWTGGTTAGPTIKTTVNGVTGTAVAIPTATASASGVVTTGDQTWAGSKTFNGTVICAKTQDASGTADSKPALIIGGGSTGAHIEIDGNEILAKSNGTTPATLYLQDSTGIVSIVGSGGFTVPNSISTFSKNVVIQSNNTLQCKRTATGLFMEMFSNNQSVGYWRNETLGTTSAKGWADIIIGNSLADTADKNAHGRIYLGANGGWASYTGETGALGGTNRHYVNFGYIKATQAWGAVWNDYAEFRETKQYIEPGRCIKEVGDDTLELTTKRLEKGCEIVSDTYGFAIGESKKAKTPTAASGRVLAYLYEDREIAKQHIGDPVCSGPNGTVSIMTEEEEQKYPSRIIGTISSVPDYDIWHAGSEEFSEEIKVNNRIWIRIK